MQATVPNASTAVLADPKEIHATVAEIAAGYEQCEQFFTRLFDEMEVRSADLARQYNAWLEERRLAARQSQDLREELRQLERQHAAWERDRGTLENELEAVRGRAAELSETLAEQKRQMETQQADWRQELRQMRRLLEMMARRQFEQQENDEGRQSSQSAADAPETPATPSDPVLDSVMGQFEMLQKDLARRRRLRE